LQAPHLLASLETKIMKTLILGAALSTVGAASANNSSAYAASAVPCKDMLKEVRSTIETAKLSDADKGKVSELEAKGVERCDADDGQRADGFFAEALNIMGK
jgi:hypothetical protein